MITSEEVDTVIFHALEALNAESGPSEQIEISTATPLFGTDTKIDSLGFVSLISDVEIALNVDFGLEISLADERATSRSESPYANVATLRDYILELASGQ
jgi:acyl carrier protein